MSDSKSRSDRSDTEKVKRRMIRTIGRLLNEKKPEDELWEYMEKEYGKKSRVLWDRMRFLTLKKLKILFEVDDVVNKVPRVARMTLTDWLIFDLVLVHDKFDLIDMRRLSSDRPSVVLSKLFALVLRFEVEGKVGEELANAWIAATVHYNATGHQCSPMLLQRRWYQLKEVTRAMFYKFWFIFRGNKRQLDKAKQELTISQLQRDVALRYSHIITEPFKQWEDCIKDRTIIMPEEFEMKMRSINLMRPTDVAGPDLVLVEPKINTIDLCDSDDEESNKIPSDDQTEPKTTEPVAVKPEPIDLDDDNDEIEASAECKSDIHFDDEIQRLQLVSNEINIGSDDEGEYDDERDSDDHANDDHDLTENASEKENDTTDVNSVEASQSVEENRSDVSTIKDKVANEEISPNLNTEVQNEVMEHPHIENDQLDLVVKVEKDAIVANAAEDVLPVIATVTSAGIPVDLGTAVENETLNLENDISTKNLDESVTIKQEKNIIIEEIDLTEYVNPQVISNLDNTDQVQQAKPVENEINILDPTKTTHTDQTIQTITENNDETIEDDIIQLMSHKPSEIVKIFTHKQNGQDDIKLVPQKQDDVIKIVSPSVEKVDEFNFNDVPIDLDFADDGIQLVDDGIEYVESEGESQETEEKEPKIDAKLLLNPVVYTTKIDKLSIFKYIPFSEEIKDKTVIDQIAFLTKPVSKLALLAEIELQKQKVKEEESRKVKILPVIHEALKLSVPESVVEVNQRTISEIQHTELVIKDEPEEADLTTQEDTIESSDDEEVERIKPTSYLLRKPNNRSYHPIQLCKNPDFNTRLKRLPVSFYTYPRNRILLNECKPMTIDLSKAFESKLLNGTLYLTQAVPCDTPSNLKLSGTVTTSSSVQSSVPITAPPVHSLMDVDKILEEELKKRVVERNRAINLPDITEVRRINQQLLTAEVTPLRKSPENQNTGIHIDSFANGIPPESDNVNFCDNPTVLDNTIVIDEDQTPEPQSQIRSDENTEVIPIPYLEPVVPHPKPTITNPTVKTNADERDNSNKNDNSLNKVRKQYRKNLQPRPNWLSLKNYPVDNSDLLLTSDTLFKMIYAIDPESLANSSFNKYVKESIQKKVVVLQRKNILKKRKKKVAPTVEEDQEKTTKQKNKTETNPEDEKQPTYVKAKVNVVYDKKKAVPTRRNFCCWARSKIEYLKGTVNRSRKHLSCENICKCCCATALADYHTEQVTKMQSFEEQVRHHKELIQNGKEKRQEEEILKKACESIETPVPVTPVASLSAVVSYNTDDNTRESETPISMNYQKQTPEPSILQKMVDAQIFNTESKNTPSDKYIQQNGLEWTTCPCNRPILKQSNQRTILIDGTHGCAYHNQDQDKKELNTKKGKIFINRKASFDRPIFIGKNKLLLTNVKQPTAELIPKIPSVAAVPATENLQMPEGINIILLPNGTLTYKADPDANITEEQLAVMPTILAAIQRQINSGNLTTVPSEPVVEEVAQNDIIGFQDTPNNNSNNPVEPTIQETIDLDSIEEPNDSIPTTIQASGTENIQDATNDTALRDEEPSEGLTTMQPQPSEANEAGNPVTISVETPPTEDIIEVDDTQTNPTIYDNQIPTTETDEGSNSVINLEVENRTAVFQDTESKLPDDEKTPQTNRKSLLSDLMEMSGINEEDVAPVTEPILPPIPTIPISTDPELHLAKTTIFSTKSKYSTISPKTSPTKYKDIYSDLSTVNSFAELKYAYQNNGLFFKLDLNTGVIVPITLCIKKKGRTATPSMPQMVIDLTDDNEIADDEKVTFNTNSTESEHNIKTTTTFKRVLDEVKNSASANNFLENISSRTYRPNILEKRSKLQKIQYRTLPRYYKKIAPKPVEMDLDSDTPMVEEYLDPSSNDESDDEPLAKKARRAAESRQAFDDVETATSFDSTQNMDIDGEVVESTMDEEVGQVILSEIEATVPKPTHLVLTRDEVHEAVPIDTFFENDGGDSDSQDDCILGV